MNDDDICVLSLDFFDSSTTKMPGGKLCKLAIMVVCLNMSSVSKMQNTAVIQEARSLRKYDFGIQGSVKMLPVLWHKGKTIKCF